MREKIEKENERGSIDRKRYTDRASVRKREEEKEGERN